MFHPKLLVFLFVGLANLAVNSMITVGVLAHFFDKMVIQIDFDAFSLFFSFQSTPVHNLTHQDIIQITLLKLSSWNMTV